MELSSPKTVGILKLEDRQQRLTIGGKVSTIIKMKAGSEEQPGTLREQWRWEIEYSVPGARLMNSQQRYCTNYPSKRNQEGMNDQESAGNCPNRKS